MLNKIKDLFIPKPSHNKLFLTGPVEVRPDVLEQMKKPLIGHRTPEFQELYQSVTKKLQELLYTQNKCFISNSSAIGVMEASVRNCIKNKSLNLVNGAFGDRWANIAEMNGKKCDRLEVKWGNAITPDMVDDKLKTGNYDTFFMVHNETSTGVMNPLEEISQVVKKYPEMLFVVDCVTSMGGVKINVDELGIDIALASNHKCFALPPIMSVFSCSDRVLERAKEIDNRGYYFDFQLYFEKYEKSFTVTSPSVSLVYAMDYQLDKILDQGITNRNNSYIKMAEYTRNWALKNDLGLFAETGYESPTVTCVKNKKSLNVASLIEKVKLNHKIVFSNGYGDLREKTFRIGHLGDITLPEIQFLLNSIEEEIKKID
jgi:aspartate aminotransferase-like enzyme